MKLKLILVSFACLITSVVNAQEVRTFETRSSFNINGNIMAVGNTLLTCDGTGNCSDVQNGSTSSSNGRNMVLVNDDPGAGFTNSSTATLTLPAGSNVLYAGLYWGGRASNNDSNRNTVQFKAAGSGSYNTVTASVIDTYGADGEDDQRPYQGFADITTLVSNAGSGSYTVGDVTLSTGNDNLGFYGGWSIAVIYQDNNEPYRRLMLMDGAVRVIDSNTETITIPNIVTPQVGSFDTFLGALVWEGDQSISGDALEFQGTPFNNNLNSSNNFWNSTITRYDSHVATKSPNYVNQLGMDLDMVDVSGELPNGLTTADIDFVTDGDWYYAHMLMFATDLHVPDFGANISKTANDINGGDIQAGDVIEYTISFENTGQDGATNTVLTDPIPANTNYVADSLIIVSADSGPTGTLTDNTGDDAGEFDSNNNEVIFRLGSGANQTNGGTILVNEGATVRFQVTVDTFIQDGDIVNIAEVLSNSTSLPNDDFQAFAQNTITMTDNTAPDAPVCTVTPNPANNGTALTASCTNVESGATVTIPGYVCSAENNNAVTCTATAGQVGVDGDETATVTDPAGNSNTAPATFVLDNDAPAAPVCSVTPNPANNGTALTATCTNVESGASVSIPGYVCSAENNNAVTCTATAGQGGVDGDETATVTDPAGNSNTAPATFVLDNSAPDAPVCTVTPNPANNGTALTASCTNVESGASVSIPGYVCSAENNNAVTCTATAGQGGVDGDETATVTDPAGNSNTAPATFVLDNSAPAAPVCTVTPNPANNGTALTATCTNVESGASISIPGYVCSAENNNAVTCTATAGQSGVDGDETATVTDPAGNSNTAPATFVLDNSAPAAPVCTVTPNPANNGTALTATCTNVESGAIVSIPGYVCSAENNNAVTCTATAGQSGVDGDETATVTDPAGNSNTAPATFVLDNSAPAAPVCTVTPNPANNGTALTATCTNVESGATVTIPGYVCSAENNNAVTCTATAGQGGVDGDETATVTDPAGNSNTAPATFVLDNTAPAAPVCTVTPNPANNGTALTATCTNVESGASISIPGYVCSAENNNAVQHQLHQCVL
nr:DUF11 domain-containing protein [Marinicella rhabdoformis]